MKKYKIGIITSSFPPKKGGIASAHYNIYQLLKDKYEVKVFTYTGMRLDSPELVARSSPKIFIRFLELAFKIIAKKYDKNVQIVFLKRIAQFAYAARMLSKPLQKFNPDIVIVPDNNIPLYWIKKRNYKVIWFARHNYARFRNNPLIGKYHWIDIQIACSMERKAFRKADFVLAPSHYMIEVIQHEMKFNLDSKVIHNFIRSNHGYNLPPTSQNSNLQVFIPSGGTYEKGSKYVFEIIRGISKSCKYLVQFIISDHICNELKFELAYLKDNVKVITPGHIPWDKNLQLLKASTIVVSPTLIENFSNALVESLTFGKPVVTFDVGGNKEIVDHAQNGFIVPYLNVNELIDRAVELLNTPTMVDEFSENAIMKAEKLSDTEKLLQQYQEVFKYLIDN